jgi:hypothetical protein
MEIAARSARLAVADARHHHAVQVIFVEVPAAGSPQPLKWAKPPAYPQQRRDAWRPARSIPTNRKAEATKRLLDAIMRQDEIVRAMMTPNPTLLRAWLARAAWPVIKGPSLQSWYNAAIDSQVRPGDVTGKRTAQEDDSVRDLINTTDSAKRNLGNLQKSSLDLLP